MKLTIVRIRPNPSGKDHPRQGSPSPSQLAGEWVDFRNDSGRDVILDGTSLWHLTYAPGKPREWARVQNFSGTLPSQKIVRVHAGRVRDASIIRPEDQAGADYHVFTGDDAYVWNNAQGDTPLLFKESEKLTIDMASYAANPPEGIVLVRQGDQLVPALSRAASW